MENKICSTKADWARLTHKHVGLMIAEGTRRVKKNIHKQNVTGIYLLFTMTLSCILLYKH